MILRTEGTPEAVAAINKAGMGVLIRAIGEIILVDPKTGEEHPFRVTGLGLISSKRARKLGLKAPPGQLMLRIDLTPTEKGETKGR